MCCKRYKLLEPVVWVLTTTDAFIHLMELKIVLVLLCSMPHLPVWFQTSFLLTWASFWAHAYAECFHHMAFLSFCMCILYLETGCFASRSADTCKKCSGFTAFYAGCLTSRTAAPAFLLLSLCQGEGCYGCSAAKNLYALSVISWKCPISTTKHAHTPHHKSFEFRWHMKAAILHVCL